MGFSGTSIHDVIVQDCDISFIGGTFLDYDQNGDPVRYGNGIQFYNSCYNCLVEGCSIWDIYDDGVTNQGGTGTQHDITYRNNIIGDCAESSFSFQFWYAPSSDERYLFREQHLHRMLAADGGNSGPIHVASNAVVREIKRPLTTSIIRNNIFSGSTIAVYITGYI